MSQYGFLFDLDGVIVDTAKYHFLAWKRLADELDIPFTEQDNERLKGVSRMASLEIILEIGNRTRTEDEKQALCQRKNDWYVEYIKSWKKRTAARCGELFEAGTCGRHQDRPWLRQQKQPADFGPTGHYRTV